MHYTIYFAFVLPKCLSFCILIIYLANHNCDLGICLCVRVHDIAWCSTVCRLMSIGVLFWVFQSSPHIAPSTEHNDITEILLNVALTTHNHTLMKIVTDQSIFYECIASYHWVPLGTGDDSHGSTHRAICPWFTSLVSSNYFVITIASPWWGSSCYIKENLLQNIHTRYSSRLYLTFKKCLHGLSHHYFISIYMLF